MEKRNKISRRRFVSNAGIATAGVSFLPYVPNIKSGGKHPNIIFIMCDQMRGDAINAMGNRSARTPNMNHLAQNGVMLRNNFANNPVCLPSRVSMFSGLYPHQTGIMCNRTKGEWLDFKNSLPWFLKQEGYRIGYVGKNHTFKENEFDNFDYVSLRGRESFRAYSKYVPPHWHSHTFWPEEDCNPQKNTNEAIAFINESNNEQPFFLHVSYFDPHPPYMAPAEYSQRYCSENIKLPEYIDPEKLGDRIAEQQKALRYDKLPKAEIKETLRYYYASIEWGVDNQIGQIINTLKGKGITDNTILVFTSDHGDFMGEFNMVRKGMFHYDALLHVPMIWYAPGIIKKGFATETLTQNVDIFPTLLDFAGIDLPKHLVGRSLRNTLMGNDSTNDERLVFAAASYSDLPDNYWDNPEPYFKLDSDVPFHTRVEQLTWKDQYKTFMLRDRNWKLIISETHDPELYFMDGGHIERENLYSRPKYKQKYHELLDKLNSIKGK